MTFFNLYYFRCCRSHLFIGDRSSLGLETVNMHLSSWFLIIPRAYISLSIVETRYLCEHADPAYHSPPEVTIRV